MELDTSDKLGVHEVVDNNDVDMLGDGNGVGVCLRAGQSSEDVSSGPDDSSSVSLSRDGVFCNAVVWRTLETFLNFTDLKFLRLVCQEFNRNIIDETNFKSRAFISMKSYRIQDEIFEPTTVWKHFKIECFKPDELTSDEESAEDLSGSSDEDPDGMSDKSKMSTEKESDDLEMSVDDEDTSWGHSFEDTCKEDRSIASGSEEHTSRPTIDWIYDLLKGADSLTIVTPCETLDGQDILPCLNKLLEAPQNLVSLSLDVPTIDINYHRLFKTLNGKVRSTFENLSEFHILPASKDLGDLCGEDYDFSRALHELSLVMRNLKVLTVPKFVGEINSDGIANLLAMIEKSKDRLSILKVAEPQVWSVGSSIMNRQNASMTIPRKVTFSKLKSLKIVINHMNSTKTCDIIQLLKAHDLERLELSISPTFPSTIFPLLSTLVNLKALRLRTKLFDGPYSWSFLNKLEKLEEFQLVIEKKSPSIRFSVNEIITNLPKSVLKVSLKGLVFNLVGQKSLTLLDDLTQWNPLNITVLNLTECFICVTDQVMECVCRHFQRLRKLDVTWSPFLSDYGFTGICSSEPADASHQPLFSIKNLKGLQYLGMARCKITDATMFHAIEFLELIHLDVTDCTNVTEEGIIAVIEKNPSLQILKTDIPISIEFLANYPRFKPDVNLDKWDVGHNSDDDFSESETEEVTSDDEEYSTDEDDDFAGFIDDGDAGEEDTSDDANESDSADDSSDLSFHSEVSDHSNISANSSHSDTSGVSLHSDTHSKVSDHSNVSAHSNHSDASDGSVTPDEAEVPDFAFDLADSPGSASDDPQFSSDSDVTQDLGDNMEY